MQNVAIRKVKDLDEPAKRWFVGIFGRELQDDEEISVTVFPARAALPLAERQAAATRMDQILDMAANNLGNVSENDFDAAVDQAMEHVRSWKR